MIKNIRAHLQRHGDFRAMMRDGARQTHEADPRPVGLLLGSLQFAGGWYLFVPFARFLPPFTKLFEAMPPWAWALYFIVSGFAQMVSSLLPDGMRYLCTRFRVSIWMFFNWFFLTVTSFLTVVWILNEGGTANYGLTLGFFPCLATAAAWKAHRLREILADETAEELEQNHHVREIKEAAVARAERLKASTEPLEV